MTQNAKNSSNGGQSPEDSLTTEQVQRIMQTGAQASQLLNNPVYNMAYQQLLNRKFQEWLASTPKESQKREGLFMQAKGLVEVTELIASAVEDALRLEQEQAERQDPGRVQQDYMDQQGFGLNLN